MPREILTRVPRHAARWLALSLLAAVPACSGGDGPSGPNEDRECDVDSPTGTITFGQTINGTLSQSDCKAPDGTFADLYRLNVGQARNVQIVLTSNAFDAYLVLLDASGEVISEDDDSAGGSNAGLAGSLQPGTYYVGANSFEPGETGAYQLTVQ